MEDELNSGLEEIRKLWRAEEKKTSKLTYKKEAEAVEENKILKMTSKKEPVEENKTLMRSYKKEAVEDKRPVERRSYKIEAKQSPFMFVQ